MYLYQIIKSEKRFINKYYVKLQIVKVGIRQWVLSYNDLQRNHSVTSLVLTQASPPTPHHPRNSATQKLRGHSLGNVLFVSYL